MWKELKIANQLYFLRCVITGNEVLCLFCDFITANEYWCETMSVADLIKRSKELNKRIKYDDLTICETVQLSVPLEVLYEGRNVDGGDNAEKVLRLKYRIHSMPYKCEWHFRRVTPEEFKNHVLLPLFSTVHGMSQQIAELQNVVRKKDVEILQYKTEGNILRRTTVATQPFNFLQFDEKYAETLDLGRSFGKVAEYMQVDTIEQKTNTTEKADNDIKTTEDSEKNNQISPNKKISPKNRKRKALQAQRFHLLRKISARQKMLNYCSSQSQSQSQSQSDGYDSSDVSGNIIAKVNAANEDIATKEPIIVLPMPTTTTVVTATLTMSPTTTTTRATIAANKTNNLPILPLFINPKELTHSIDATTKESSSKLTSTPSNGIVSPTDLEGTQTTILSIAEMNQKLDFILKELKHLEEQRIADMKKRLGGNFD